MEADHPLSAHLSQARALLDTPSSESWRALVELLHTLREEADVEQLLAHVIARLDAEWPAHLRQAPSAWISYPHEEPARRALFARLWSFGLLFAAAPLDLEAHTRPFNALAAPPSDLTHEWRPPLTGSFDGTTFFMADQAEAHHNDGSLSCYTISPLEYEDLLEGAALLDHPNQVHQLRCSADGTRLAALWMSWTPGDALVVQLLDLTREDDPLCWEAALLPGAPRHTREALDALDDRAYAALQTRYALSDEREEASALPPLLALSYDGAQVAAYVPWQGALHVGATATDSPLRTIDLNRDIQLKSIDFLTPELLLGHDTSGRLHLIDLARGEPCHSQPHGSGAEARVHVTPGAPTVWVVTPKEARCFTLQQEAPHEPTLAQVSQVALPQPGAAPPGASARPRHLSAARRRPLARHVAPGVAR